MQQESLQLTGGNHRGDRRELDYYPTPPEVTHALMQFLKVPESTYVWEPACGERYMSKVISEYCHVLATDIVEGIDYLALSKANFVDGIITNPPFNLAEDFIRKAVGEVSFCAFLLKSQFWHAAKRQKLFEECQPSFVLPLTWRPDFLFHTREVGGKSAAPTMEVCWNVWVKDAPKATLYVPLSKPKL